MKSFFKWALVTYCLLFFVGCQKDLRQVNVSTSSGNSIQRIKPNIIFILADDVGYEIPTCDGGRSYSTPNIDRLANTGMRFTQCRAAPLCSPSRFMILTGKYNFRNYTTWGQMDLGQRTIGNMFHDAGYATCYAGKWQLDGGDNAIHTFGFDKYSVWLPFKVCPEEDAGSRYKSAQIYQDGTYLPDSLTNNKYSEDIFSNYVLKFITSNKSKPFFIYYSMILCHHAYSPTPDDPEYATWDPNPLNSDSTFFPSMVRYADKKIGLIVNKLKKLGLDSNTIIVYAGDNGTQREITSLFRHTSITGAKGKTIEYGIHVPLICRWPAKITPGSLNNDLIDFTDILPSFADIAGIPVPTTYGPLDGTSFYPQLKGHTGTTRTWVFTHYNKKICENNERIWRYAQDSIYKLYETGEFYKFKKDIFEERPLPDSTLNTEQKQIKKNLQAVIAGMHS